MNKQFYHLLRAVIGIEPFSGHSLTSDEWKTSDKLSVVHGVTAVVFDFVRQLPKSEAPDMAWAMI